MPSVRAVVHDLLRELGCSAVFGNPGSTELPFLRDFPADFRYVLGLSEAAVVGMADGYAQASGRPAFVSLHSASGPGNAMGAVVNAWHNRAPMVIMSGQQDRRHLAIEPYLFARSGCSDEPRPAASGVVTCRKDGRMRCPLPDHPQKEHAGP